MLRRQQALVIIVVKEQLLEGAVSMVQYGLEKLADREVLELDEDRKASLVNDLLRVFGHPACSKYGPLYS